MRTNFNHTLRLEDELAESIKNDPFVMERATSIILMEMAKTLSIMADTLENIERRLTLDKNNSDN